MNKIIDLRYLCLFLLVSIKFPSANCNILKDACLTDSNCDATEYCDHDFPNPVGKCKLGSEAGQSCLRDRHCASKRCHFLKCANRLKMKDGPCKIDSDCPDDQYCMKLPNTDDLRMCTNRNILGACLKDSECLSGRCHLFTCVKL